MEECLIAEKIKVETSSVPYTENEKFKVEGEDCIKNELLHDEELQRREDPSSVKLELAYDEGCIRTENEVYDENPYYDQLKKEIEDTEDYLIVKSRDCDDEDIGAHCSIKQELDYDINEDFEIKNDSNFEDNFINENFLQSCSDDTENSFQSEGGILNSTHKPRSDLSYSKRKKQSERNAPDFEKLYKCSDCDFSSTRFSSLYNHRKVQHSVGIGPEFKCSLCEFTTRYQGSLKIHVDAVHLKLKKYKCPFCDYSATRSLKSHIAGVHSGKNYQCDECDYSTSWKYNLQNHKIKIHFKDIEKLGKEFKCTICDYVTHYKPYLSNHIRIAHSNKQYKCNDCGYVTTRKINFVSHRRIKHSDGVDIDIKCDECDFVTKYKSSLNSHVKSVHLKITHKCSDCDYSTVHASNLRFHRKMKHSNESNTELKCNSCDYVTKDKGILGIHINSVHLKIQHRCSDCDFSTTWMRVLRKHKKMKHPD